MRLVTRVIGAVGSLFIVMSLLIAPWPVSSQSNSSENTGHSADSRLALSSTLRSFASGGCNEQPLYDDNLPTPGGQFSSFVEPLASGVQGSLIDNATIAESAPDSQGRNFDGGRPGDLDLLSINPRLDSGLNQVLGDPSGLAAAGIDSDNQTGESYFRVIVECQPGSEESVREAVDNAGTLEGEYNGLLQVSLSLTGLSALASDAAIKFIHLPEIAVPDVVSEGVQLMNATNWGNAGYNGHGVKIGVLDVGFYGYTTMQTQDELPDDIGTWWCPSLGGPGNERHGTACAELIYDTVPGASYYLANFNTVVEYGLAVDWLIEQEVDIISCSVSYPGKGPGDGSGPICSIVDKAVNDGILWLQSAGNFATQHWKGSFSDSDNDDWHNFVSDNEANSIYAQSGDTIVVFLTWNDSWGKSSNDYNLLLVDKYDNLLDWSCNVQDGDDDPYERCVGTASYTGYYYPLIEKYSGSTKTLELYSGYHSLLYQTKSGSISVPADSTKCLTVGAVPWNDTGTIEYFSSQGPNAKNVKKPDLVAPDGVSTRTYGSEPFYGTSAAAPGAAGIAAIVKQIHPEYTPAQLKEDLEDNTMDLGSSGKDNVFGSGMLKLLDNPPGKIVFTTDPRSISAGAVSGSIELEIQDAAGNPLPVQGNTVINLASNSAKGYFDKADNGAFSSKTLKVTIPSGSTSAVFFYKDTLAGIPVMTAAGTDLVSGTQSITVIAGAAAQIRVESAANGSGAVVAVQNLAAGSGLTVYAVTRDQYGNYTGNPASAGWSLTGITGGVTASDLGAASGASVTFNAHLTGTAVIHPALAGLTSVDSGKITVTRSSFHHLQIMTQPASTLSIESPLNSAPVVTACDSGNNPLSNISITAQRDPSTGSGNLAGTLTVKTGSNGMAAFSNLTYDKTDVFKIKFVSGAASVISNAIGPLASGAVKTMTFITPPVSGITVDAILGIQPVVLAVDKSGNPVSGAVVMASVGSGTGFLRGSLTATSGADGRAAFSGLGYSKAGETFKITLSCGNASVISEELGPLAAGELGSLSVAVAPRMGDSVDVVFATQPQILAADQFGNPKSGITVTVSLGSGGGVLRGSPSAVSGSDGKAVFSGLGYSKAGETFILHFSSGSLSVNNPESGPVLAGAAAALIVDTEPQGGVTVDDLLAVQPQILVIDQFGNPVSGVAVSASAGGESQLRGALTATSGTNGKAVFSGLAYSRSGELFTLRFMTGTLEVDSGPLGPLTAGAAVALSLTVQPAGEGSVDDNLTIQPEILVTDQFGNPRSGTEVTAAATNPKGSLRGNLSAVSDTLGLASFSGLAYNQSGVNFTLTFTSGSLSVVSQPVGKLAAGIPFQIVVETKADGNGSIAGPCAVLVGQGLAVYGVTRDQFGNYAGNPENTTWSLNSFSGGELNAVEGASVVLVGRQPGTAVIQAANGSLTSIDSNTIFVNLLPPKYLTFSVAAESGSSVDDFFQTAPQIVVTDNDTTPLGGIPITVALDSGAGALTGASTEISSASGQVTFAGLGYTKSSDNFTIRFTADNISVASSTLGPLGPGAAVTLGVEISADGGGVVAAQDLTVKKSLTGYSIARDQYGNLVGSRAGFWSLENESGVKESDLLASADNLTAVFTPTEKGSTCIRVAQAGLTSIDSGLISVVAARSSGGGGGGGGSSSSTIGLNGLVSVSPVKVDGSGYTKSAAHFKTADGKLTLDVASGTRLLTSSNGVLTALTAAVPPAPPDPLENNAIIAVYNLGPEGSKFNPGITLTLYYSADDLAAGVAEKDLFLAWYDGTQWQNLNAAPDTLNKKISAQITHFSLYAIIAVLPEPAEVNPQPLPSPTAAITPSPSVVSTPASATPSAAEPQKSAATPSGVIAAVSTTTPTPAVSSETANPSPAENDGSGMPVWAIVLIVAAALAVVVVLVLIIRRPKSK